MTTIAATHIEPDKKRPLNLGWWLRTAVGVAIPILLLILGYSVVGNVNAANSGALGLVQVLPLSFFAVVAALAVSFVVFVRAEKPNPVALLAHIFALICLFHGVVSWIEQSPRFPVAYIHLGFIDIIQRTNHTLPSLDARMSWPGFFAMGAAFDRVAGLNSAYPVLLWAPLVFNLTYAPLVFSIARTASIDKRIPWIATYLFFSISWVGQDYFSPQAVNFLFFLAFMAVILQFFRTDRAALPRPLRGLGLRVSALVKRIVRTETLRPGSAPIIATAARQRALLVVGLVLIYSASVVSHQLTPFFILLEIIILVILRRVALRGFPLLLIVIVFSYISYGAIGFWSGHFKDIFGGLGQVSSVASQNVGSKVQGHSNHTYVIYGRLALSAALWATAAWGVVRRLRTGRTDIFLLVGFLAPFLVLGGQSYGGEAILRVFLFSLPFAAILATFALLPTDVVKLNATRSLIIAVTASLLGPAFMLARFGNEQFEYVSKAEYQGSEKLFQIAPPGSELVSIDSNVAWQIKDADSYTFSVASHLEPFEDPNQIYQSVALHGTRSTYLYVSRTQLQSIAVNDGRPKDWGVAMEQSLVSSGRFNLVYKNPDVEIFSLIRAAKAGA